jgi:hypothetical protein
MDQPFFFELMNHLHHPMLDLAVAPRMVPVNPLDMILDTSGHVEKVLIHEILRGDKVESWPPVIVKQESEIFPPHLNTLVQRITFIMTHIEAFSQSSHGPGFRTELGNYPSGTRRYAKDESIIKG